MSYAGITKGFTALGAAMMLAATREGTAETLHARAGRKPARSCSPGSPGRCQQMYPKAYRWVAEMEEIAEFVGDDAAARQIIDGMAPLYERLAADFDGDKREIDALTAFVKGSPADIGRGKTVRPQGSPMQGRQGVASTRPSSPPRAPASPA